MYLVLNLNVEEALFNVELNMHSNKFCEFEKQDNPSGKGINCGLVLIE